MAQNAYVAPTIQASGTTWSQYKAGGLDAVLANLASTNGAKSNPSTQATVAVSGTGGLLPAGNYYLSYSFVDPYGETLAGGRSAQFTQTSGAKPAVTLPSLPTGVLSMNIYLTPAGGAAGTETLYATGVTGTSFSLDFAAPADNGATLPTSNTTGYPSAANALKVTGRSEILLQNFAEYLSAYMAGGAPNPAQRRVVLHEANRFAGILATWAKAQAEINTLIAANPPTGITAGTMGTGMPNNKWTFP